MNKKLPSVFANKNVGIVNNNKEMFYSKDSGSEAQENKLDKNIRTIMIRKKINDLFNSDSFVYKVNVIITTTEGDREYTLIAKNNDTLLTMNNESININDVVDIRKI